MEAKKWKGSMTVELTIIFPVIFFTMLAMISMCITHYQNIVTSVAAMEAAARGAAYWDRIGGAGAWDFQSGNAGTNGGAMVAADYESRDPYRFVIDTSRGRRLNNVQAFAKWRMDQNPDIALGEESTTDPVASKGGFDGEGFGLLQSYVTVTVTKHYINPVDSILEDLGITPETERQVTASAPVTSPGEFVRNMSLLYDLIRGTGSTGT